MLLKLIFAASSLVLSAANSPFCRPKNDFLDEYENIIHPSYERIIRGKPESKGHFGAVYFCKVNGVDSAVKVVSTVKDSQMNIALNEKRMANILAATPGVVVPYGCFFERNKVAFWMLKKGPSFSKLLRHFKTLSFHRKLDVFIMLAENLHELHRSYVIHNDLKPANILARNRHFSDVYLIDFGCACLAGETCYGGTKVYSPPEKLNGKLRAHGEYSLDVWSFLIMVIVLYSGATSDHIATIFSSRDQGCWSHMTVSCYTFFIKKLTVALRSAPAWFTRVVMSGLRYTPSKRPSMALVVKRLHAGRRSAFG